jgi:hypothetical protein
MQNKVAWLMGREMTWALGWTHHSDTYDNLGGAKACMALFLLVAATSDDALRSMSAHYKTMLECVPWSVHPG